VHPPRPTFVDLLQTAAPQHHERIANILDPCDDSSNITPE
jgi:hypothetical protein